MTLGAVIIIIIILSYPRIILYNHILFDGRNLIKSRADTELKVLRDHMNLLEKLFIYLLDDQLGVKVYQNTSIDAIDGEYFFQKGINNIKFKSQVTNVRM
jgi:hypothetical protein